MFRNLGGRATVGLGERSELALPNLQREMRIANFGMYPRNSLFLIFAIRDPNSAIDQLGVDLPAHRPRPSDELVPWPTERRRRDRPENRLGNRLSKHFDSAVRPDPIQTLSLFPAARVAAGDKSSASAKV